MHRSGTSAISGTIAKLGASPPKTLMRGLSDNPKGHWESEALMQLHDELLAGAGSQWDDWRPFNAQWYDTALAAQFKERAKALLASEFDASPVFILKDPRVCRFAPFWLDIFAEEDITPRLIVPIRLPLEVAQSLRMRNGFSLNHGLLLWLRHALDAEAVSRSHARAIVEWEVFLQDWRPQAERIATELGVHWPRLSDLAAAEIDAFLIAELKRKRVELEAARAHPDMHEWAMQAYEALRELARNSGSNSARATLDDLRARFDEACRLFGRELAGLELKLGDLRQTLEAERQGRSQETQALAEARARAAETERLQAALQAERETLASERQAHAGAAQEFAQSVEAERARAGEFERLQSEARQAQEAAAQAAQALEAALGAEREARAQEAASHGQALEQERARAGELERLHAEAQQAHAAAVAAARSLEAALAAEREARAAEAAAHVAALEALVAERDAKVGEAQRLMQLIEAMRVSAGEAQAVLRQEFEAVFDGERQARAAEAATHIAALEALAAERDAKAKEVERLAVLVNNMRTSAAQVQGALRGELIRALERERQAYAREAAGHAAKERTRQEDRREYEALLSEIAKINAARKDSDILVHSINRDRENTRAENEKLRTELARLVAELSEASIRYGELSNSTRLYQAQLDQIKGSRSWRLITTLNKLRPLGHSRMLDSKENRSARSASRQPQRPMADHEKKTKELRVTEEHNSIAIIKNSGLFDENWYMNTYRDVVDTAISPIQHFLEIGIGQNYDPSLYFCTKYYLDNNPDVKASGTNPFLHYLHSGGFEGRKPTPFFDSAWYLERNPDVKESGINPLIHYVKFGAFEARNPNPLFDSKWYLEQNPEVRDSEINPLLHYLLHRMELKHLVPHPMYDHGSYLGANPDIVDIDPIMHYLEKGEREGRNPFVLLDRKHYLFRNPDVAISGVDPAEHYQKYGSREGRPARRLASSVTKPVLNVSDVDFRVILEPEQLINKENVIFITHQVAGKFKEHTRRYIQSLKSANFNVILVIVVDSLTDTVWDIDTNLYDSLVLRQNHGYDFSAWAHVLKLWSELWGSKLLILANDSVYGPTNTDRLIETVSAVRNSEADCVGLTDSYERGGWHLQSYFLAFKQRCLTAIPHMAFWENVQSYTDKQMVIDEYELKLSPLLRQIGMKCLALFPADRTAIERKENPTLFQWKKLLDRGFPFIKVQALRDNIDGVDKSSWQEAVSLAGYDPQIIEGHLTALQRQSGERATIKADNSNSLVETRKPRSGDIKVAFIGPWNYNNGLGFASRGYISALWQTGFKLNIYPIYRPFHTHGKAAPTIDIRDFDGRADVCIVHLNPDGWPALLDDKHLAVIEQAKKVVGLWVWEMEQVPLEWKSAFDLVDRIWAPSSYCKTAFQAVFDKPVQVLPHVVNIPELNCASPDVVRKFGLPAGRRFILYNFDGASYLVRKNPFALIRAFERSGLSERGWSLILKTKNVMDHPKQGQELIALAKRESSIFLLNQHLSSRENRALLNTCSIYASPHSAEGFGLTIAEAMAAGKIVVSTNYSGPKDFLDETCGFPVKWNEVKLDRDYGHYKRGGIWAQIDEDALVDALNKASEAAFDPTQKIGFAAKERIREKCSPTAVGALIRKLVLELAR